MNCRKDVISTARVLKLGGSLLSVADWPQRLQTWLSEHPAPLTLLLVGGGDIVESIRLLDAQHHFTASFSHWLCIDLLSATASIAAQLLPEFPLIATPEELQQIVGPQCRVDSTIGSTCSASRVSQTSLTYIVDVTSFYGRTCRLPESWDTTSDSLAAWLARVVGAQELVLFKSMTPAKEYKTPQVWGEQGIVDAAFADTLTDSVSVQIVNLLSEEWDS